MNAYLHAAALQRFCPTCGARPGMSCRTVRNRRPLDKPHRQRITPPAKRQRIPQPVRVAVTERAGGACEGAEHYPTLPCRGLRELHHVVRRSQGGPDTAENLKMLCSAHHQFVHENPAWAMRVGLLSPVVRRPGALR